jgi:hypothetical protein
MHGEESQVLGDLRQSEILIEEDFKICATTRNGVANDICVPRNILRDTPDLSYVQPEGNYYFKIADSYQILKSKLPNSEQSYKGKVKTHNYINRQNQSTTGKL